LSRPAASMAIPGFLILREGRHGRRAYQKEGDYQFMHLIAPAKHRLG